MCTFRGCLADVPGKNAQMRPEAHRQGVECGKFSHQKEPCTTRCTRCSALMLASAGGTEVQPRHWWLHGHRRGLLWITAVDGQTGAAVRGHSQPPTVVGQARKGRLACALGRRPSALDIGMEQSCVKGSLPGAALVDCSPSIITCQAGPPSPPNTVSGPADACHKHLILAGPLASRLHSRCMNTSRAWQGSGRHPQCINRRNESPCNETCQPTV
jgi:hypothetical protein